MPVSVSLQKMFSYSLLLFVVILVISLIIVIVALVVYFSSRKKTEKPAQKKPIQETVQPVTGKAQFRHKYLAQLDSLENSCQNQEITVREAYQHLSLIVRHFVYEMTGKRVQYATLEELKGADMPALYDMIKYCYAQEFSPESTSNIYDALHRARKVIQEWN
ncbi:MAG: hypothetical protein K2I10_13705 [Lachnospiraceae bacterium]|nr:hypothetical protein [Lachnospiraceae bacterium]